MFILRGGSSFIVDLILDSHFSVLFPRFVFFFISSVFIGGFICYYSDS
jgi:hypothetical protein